MRSTSADWRITVLESIDYLCLVVFLLLAFVHPWLVKRGREWQLFFLPLILGFLWGFWRMATFDPAMDIDVPGMGYLVVGFTLGVLALILYGVRRVFGSPKMARPS